MNSAGCDARYRGHGRPLYSRGVLERTARASVI